jgi:hypothetical protein
MIGGTDAQTRAIVEEVLTSIGVPSVIEGSAVYGVQVHGRDRERARQALRGDARLTGRWIQYTDEPGK